MKKSFGVHFILVVAGQIISILGNSIFSFALSLYVLDDTESALIFGVITALSALPWAVCGPLGGILADHVNKRNIMVALDFSTFAVILAFAFTIRHVPLVGAVVVMKLIFSSIQALYQPAVTSSIPVLVREDFLVQANSIVAQVNSVSRIAGPVIAGFLYGIMSIETIVVISAAFFFLSAVMELFIRIPDVARKSREKVSVKGEMSQVWHFFRQGHTALYKLLLSISAVSLLIAPIFSVGLPYLIKIHLGLSAQLYGICSGVTSAGMIAGGLLTAAFPRRVKFTHSGALVLAASALLLPMAAVLLFGGGIPAFLVICLSAFLIMICVNMVTILLNTLIQTRTPIGILGKVASVATIITGCADPAGQVIYGFLFDRLSQAPWLILALTFLASIPVAFLVRKYSRRAAEE